MNLQRALSSQSCSTSAPSSTGHTAHHPILCSASSSDAARPDSRHRQPFSKGYSTGCYVQRPPPQLVSSRNGAGPAVMQGLGTPLPSQHSEIYQKSLPDTYDVTEFVAETLLPTRTGKYRLRGYRHTFDGGRTFTEPSVIMTGRPENGSEIPVRVHDACFTSEVLGSLKCDCAGQLQMAMDYIQENGPGLIIYLQQEGRGIGLANKIAAYALQEEGLDTVDANRALGLPDDCREYSSVKNILHNLGIRSIRLMTNNPRKIKVLEELGVLVTARIPCIVEAQEHSMGYLATKQARMAHWMEDGPDSLDGSYCYWNHDGEPLKPSAIKGAYAQTQHSNGKLIGRPQPK